ncbi:MAG: hypothetical protein AAF518_21205 [Spirochaetota bacterium]
MFPNYEELLADFIAETDELLQQVESLVLELENRYDHGSYQ